MHREQGEEEQELGGGGLLWQRWWHFSRPHWRRGAETTETNLARQTGGEEDRKFWVIGEFVIYFASAFVAISSSQVFAASSAECHLCKLPSWSLLTEYSFTAYDVVLTIPHLHLSDDAKHHLCRFAAQMEFWLKNGEWNTGNTMPQFRTGGFCCSKLLLSACCYCWQLAHLDRLKWGLFVRNSSIWPDEPYAFMLYLEEFFGCYFVDVVLVLCDCNSVQETGGSQQRTEWHWSQVGAR